MTKELQILELQSSGLSNRDIANKVRCSRRHVRRVLGSEQARYQSQIEKKGGPKILVLDIETAPLECYTWGIFKQTIMPHSIIKDWCVLTWAAKWLFDSGNMTDTLPVEDAIERNDRSVVESAWQVLDEADIVVAHYGARFDLPRLTARFIKHKMPPPTPYVIIDTKREAGKLMDVVCYKLDYLAEYFELEERKSSSSFDLWKRYVTGDSSVVAPMLRYNVHDILTLEELYLELRPWIRSHPNLGTYMTYEGTVCPACGNSENLDWNSYYHTPAGKYASFRCGECGAIGRSRYSALTKEDRETLAISTAR